MDRNKTGYSVAMPRLAQRLTLAAATLTVLASAVAPAAAASRPERSLAGIAIFSPGSLVTRKFGNPNQILVGGVAPATNTPGGAGGMNMGGGPPGAQGSAPGGPPAGISALPGFPGIPGGGGFPGGGFPGGASGFPGAPAAAAAVKPPVTLVYDRSNGGSLEFTISPDKRVVQIRETGYIGAYATARGIKLGMLYSAVIARYGYPEDTTINGSIINIDYKDTLHCGFQFLDQRLVGIVVSSPD